MKASIIFLLFVVGIGISGFGILSNDIFLSLQKLIAFGTIAEFNNWECHCEDPMNPGTFGMTFCDFNQASAGYIGAVADATCNFEALNAQNMANLETTESEGSEPIRGTSGNLYSEYGSDLPENYWYGEGCSPEFWEANPSAWPQGSDPASLFNDAFLTTLSIHRILVTTEQEITDDNLLPVRGRVSSDGVAVGTATLAREDSAENTEDYVDMVSLNAVGESGSDDFPTLTKILDAPEISLYGAVDDGGLNEVTRQSVAALLNARHPDIFYHYTEQQVIDYAKWAIETSYFYPVIRDFTLYNSLHEVTICPSP